MKRMILIAMGLLGMAGILSAQDSGGPMTGKRLALEGKSIRNTQAFEGHSILVTQGTAIEQAIQVTFHACDKIVFEEGFTLVDGAEMTATVEENCKDGRAFTEMSGGVPELNIGPNPFMDQTQVKLELSEPAIVTLEIFTLEGRRVAAPISGTQIEAGSHRIQLNLADLPSGSYIYRAQIGETLKRGKLIRLE